MKKPWKLCLLLKKPTKSNKLKKTKTCIIVLIKTATYSRKRENAAQSCSPNISCLDLHAQNPCIISDIKHCQPFSSPVQHKSSKTNCEKPMQNFVMFTSDFIREEFMELAIQLQKHVISNETQRSLNLQRASWHLATKLTVTLDIQNQINARIWLPCVVILSLHRHKHFLGCGPSMHSASGKSHETALPFTSCFSPSPSHSTRLFWLLKISQIQKGSW